MDRKKNNLCACGCGTLVAVKYKRGHKKNHMPRRPDSEIFTFRPYGRRNSTIMGRYFKKRQSENTLRCDICGLTEWMGQRAPLVVDHIDGVNSNDQLSNLRLLCRNCDGQQPTFAGRNIGKRKNAERKILQSIANEFSEIVSITIDGQKLEKG